MATLLPPLLPLPPWLRLGSVDRVRVCPDVCACVYARGCTRAYMRVCICVYIHICGKNILHSPGGVSSTGEEGQSTGKSSLVLPERSRQRPTFNGVNERSHRKFCSLHWRNLVLRGGSLLPPKRSRRGLGPYLNIHMTLQT